MFKKIGKNSHKSQIDYTIKADRIEVIIQVEKPTNIVLSGCEAFTSCVNVLTGIPNALASPKSASFSALVRRSISRF